MPKIAIYSFLLFFLFVSCKKQPQAPAYQSVQSMVVDSAAVVSPHPLASEIGIEILRKGGNAVDAAVAVQFALAVVYPRAGNIGGGGFMVIRDQDGSTTSLDYREKAPQSAHRNLYLDSLENVIKGLSTEGVLAAGVPGTVAGLLDAHQKHGKLKDVAALIEPAILLAKNGFNISEAEAKRLNRFQDAFRKHNNTPNPFIKDTFIIGDLLVQKELAHTLNLIKEKGKAGFYEGVVADAIVAEMKNNNGIISKSDLQKYETQWRTPISVDYKNYRIFSMPPPSSGGLALGQLLKIVEGFPISDYGFHSQEAIHLMVEAERRVYADRATYLGDPDFYTVPVDSLLSSDYLTESMSTYTPEQASVSDSIDTGSLLIKESFETTHTSIVDSDGNAVSVTTTLNSNYGCKVWVDGAGFFLNNEMDDFSVKPGVPNQFGLVGAEANAIQAEKRMLSSMTPTIIEKDGELFMVLGAPGGSTIITAVFQVFLNVAEFGMPLDKAVTAPRFHHQWLPDEIIIEKGGIPESTQQQLLDMGHNIRAIERMAVIKAIQRLPDGSLHGAGDFRNPDDDVSGW